MPHALGYEPQIAYTMTVSGDLTDENFTVQPFAIVVPLVTLAPAKVGALTIMLRLLPTQARRNVLP